MIFFRLLPYNFNIFIVGGNCKEVVNYHVYVQAKRKDDYRKMIQPKNKERKRIKGLVDDGKKAEEKEEIFYFLMVVRTTSTYQEGKKEKGEREREREIMS